MTSFSSSSSLELDPPTLLELPDEILLQVLRLVAFADPTAFWRARRTCRRLLRLADDLSSRLRPVARALCKRAMPAHAFHRVSTHRVLDVGLDYLRLWRDFRATNVVWKGGISLAEEMSVERMEFKQVLQDGGLKTRGTLKDARVTALVCNGDTFFLALETGHLFWMRWAEVEGEGEGPCPFRLDVPASSLCCLRVGRVSGRWRLFDLPGWREVNLERDVLVAAAGQGTIRFFRFRRRTGHRGRQEEGGGGGGEGGRNFDLVSGEVSHPDGLFALEVGLVVGAHRGRILACKGRKLAVFSYDSSADVLRLDSRVLIGDDGGGPGDYLFFPPLHQDVFVALSKTRKLVISMHSPYEKDATMPATVVDRQLRVAGGELMWMLGETVTAVAAHLNLLLLGTGAGGVFSYRFHSPEHLLELDLADWEWNCQAPEVAPIVTIDAAYTSRERLEITFATRRTLFRCHWETGEHDASSTNFDRGELS